mgnify:CR=1 FL=1
MIFRLTFEQLLLVLPIILFSLSVHEYSHGLAALMLGDRTAKRQGRLTLNPLKHLDLIGTLMLLSIGFGWAKPVPIMVQNLSRGRKSLYIVALAGPISNFIIALFFSLLFNLFGLSNDYGTSMGPSLLSQFIVIMVFLNVVLGVFNLLPIPPLDGGNIIYSLLPDKLADSYSRYSSRFVFIFIILIFYIAWGHSDIFIAPVKFIFLLLIQNPIW